MSDNTDKTPEEVSYLILKIVKNMDVKLDKFDARLEALERQCVLVRQDINVLRGELIHTDSQVARLSARQDRVDVRLGLRDD